METHGLAAAGDSKKQIGAKVIMYLQVGSAGRYSRIMVRVVREKVN